VRHRQRKRIRCSRTSGEARNTPHPVEAVRSALPTRRRLLGKGALTHYPTRTPVRAFPRPCRRPRLRCCGLMGRASPIEGSTWSGLPVAALAPTPQTSLPALCRQACIMSSGVKCFRGKADALRSARRRRSRSVRGGGVMALRHASRDELHALVVSRGCPGLPVGYPVNHFPRERHSIVRNPCAPTPTSSATHLWVSLICSWLRADPPASRLIFCGGGTDG